MDDLEAFDVDIEGFDLITIARLYDSALRRIGLRKDGRAAVHQADPTNRSTSTAEGDYREVMIDIKKDLKGDDDLDDDVDNDRGAAAGGAPLPKAGDDDGLVAGVLNFLACGSAEDATGRKNSACLDAPEPPVAHL